MLWVNSFPIFCHGQNGRTQATIKAMLRFFCVAFFAAAVGTAGFISPSVFAQTPSPAAPPNAPAPADVQKTLTDISDLSLLRALLPVKLKPEQIDKILAPLQTVRNEGASRRKADEDAVRALSAEVTKTRTSALTKGEPIPAETEAKIVKLYADADKRFAAAKKKAIDQILPVIQITLTPEQRTTVKNYVQDKMLDGKKFSDKAKPDAIENAALEIYIERILLDERTIAVLTALRAGSKTADETPAPVAPAAPATTPAAKP